MSVTINMPQMASNGLSENWLFKYCGDLHWQALCDSLAIQSSELRDDSGARLYPTFVAISCRYSQPLSSVRENQRFDTAVDLSRFGSSFYHSRVTLFDEAARFVLEMLTTFVARSEEGRNDLRRSTPRSDLACSARELCEPPAILTRSQGMRRDEIRQYDFNGCHLDPGESSLNLTRDYEPSPYVDFNGANLLYFAAYPTICDTLERQIIVAEGLGRQEADWAMATSTTARDVYYYANLDLGSSLRVKLKRLDCKDQSVVMHTTMTGLSDEKPIADLLTERRIVA